MKSVLSKNIIRLRKKKGLSQEKLAELTGLNRGTVAYYENEDSEKTHVINLHLIAKVLGVTVDELIEEKLEKDKNEIIPSQIDYRTMEKLNLIMALPREKRHMIYTIIDALTKLEESK